MKIIVRFFNRMKLNRKFLIIYVCCLILPLIITDTIVLYSLIKSESNDLRHDRESEAANYVSILNNNLDFITKIGSTFYNSRELNEFVTTRYESDYDYLVAHSKFVNSSYIKTINGLNSDEILVYTNNSTVLNGGTFHNLEQAENELWYKLYREKNVDETILIFHDDTVGRKVDERRNMYYVRRLNRFNPNAQTYFVVRIDTYALADVLSEYSYSNPMYICKDDYVFYSNQGFNVPYSDVQKKLKEESSYTLKEFNYRGSRLHIYVFNHEIKLFEVLNDRIGMIILFLGVTFLLPLILMRVIEQSITTRIRQLSRAFKGDDKSTFSPISKVTGTDEIAELMTDYNKIVDINNNLIRTVYIEKLKEQEIDIARKNAELFALQSQINPHFLFNALESIRMHSVLRGEDETATMVQKLAIMERQTVDWQNDNVTIDREMDFVEAYLSLQNYRFGDRLSYDVDIDNDCQNILIPKLTITTFVENACVHGIESKLSEGWVFIRIYKKNGKLNIEIEDTGNGMTEEEVQDYSFKVNNVDISMIKNQEHVGSLNACLRMRMMYEDKVRFIIESEEGIGFTMIIQIDEDAIEYERNK